MNEKGWWVRVHVGLQPDGSDGVVYSAGDYPPNDRSHQLDTVGRLAIRPGGTGNPVNVRAKVRSNVRASGERSR